MVVGWMFVGGLVFSGNLFGFDGKNAQEELLVGQGNKERKTEQDSYHQYVELNIQKAEDLLKELKKKAETTTGEENADLERMATKLHADVDHAKRVFKNLDVIDPEPWLRNKTEVNAVLADLMVTYDRAVPLLHARTRYLQEAVDRAHDAVYFGKKDQRGLFVKMTELGLTAAEKAQKAGVNSEFLKEAIAQLKDVREHIHLDKVGGAVILAKSAYLHLNSALHHQVDHMT
jgi:hypothetical protein